MEKKWIPLQRRKERGKIKIQKMKKRKEEKKGDISISDRNEEYKTIKIKLSYRLLHATRKTETNFKKLNFTNR